MAQNIGINAPTRIPSFGDDASIEEALKKYHYGIDEWAGDPVQDNLGMDGNFKAVKSRLIAVEDILGPGSGELIRGLSLSSSPNIIGPQTISTVPLTIEGISGQTASLQTWKNIISSVNTTVATIYPSGASSFRRYINIGDTAQSSTVGLNISLTSNTHKGIVIKAASDQSSNLQEWVASNGSTILGRVDSTGKMFSNNIEVVTLSQTQTLTNKTLTSPTISGGSIANATSITLTGSQAINSFRTRNINISTSTPSGGNDGDVWIVYS